MNNNLTPLEQKHNDLYIVEFPRSGITWLMTILVNVFLKMNKLDKYYSTTLFNIEQFIPDIHVSNRISSIRWPFFFPFYRIIKSHSEYNPEYKFVIYLIRHPVDVMESYYRFAVEMKQFDGDIISFVKDPLWGINKWKSHVNSWLNRGTSAQRLHLLKYEDLKEKPLVTLSELFGNLGLNIPEKIIKYSLKKASFENMKKKEILYSKNNPCYNINFFRKGKIGFEKKLKEEWAVFIIKEAREIIKKFWG